MVGSALLAKYGPALLKWVAIVGSIAATVGGVYWYVTSTQQRLVELGAQIEQAEEQNRQTEEELSAAQQTIQQMLRDSEALRRREQILREEMTRAEDRSTELLNLLRDHDLTKLTRARPGLIERRINDGTEDVFEDLRNITAID